MSSENALMSIRLRGVLVVALLALAAGAACGDDEQGETAREATATTTTAASGLQGEASVRFVEPADGATVASPVKVRMEATNFTIEPAGETRPGAGHFHIMIDTGCVPPGEVIPSDASHLHYGKAQTEAELTLGPGRHTLCLQAADGAHQALDLTDTITIEVVE